MARGRRKFRQHRRPHPNVIMAGFIRRLGGTTRSTGRALRVSAMYISLVHRGQRPVTPALAAKIADLV